MKIENGKCITPPCDAGGMDMALWVGVGTGIYRTGIQSVLIFPLKRCPRRGPGDGSIYITAFPAHGPVAAIPDCGG